MNIDKYLIDDAVLFPYSGVNGYGEMSFGTAVDIKVRWEDRQEIFVSVDGINLTSKAIVHVNRDIVPNGYLYKGTKSELTPSELANPKLVEDAFAIKAFRKMKSVSGKYTLRKVYLFGGDVNEGQGF